MQKEDHSKHHDDPDGGIHDAPTLPSIKVIVAKGKEDVTIKVADRGETNFQSILCFLSDHISSCDFLIYFLSGGGMPRSVTNRIWTFAKSTLSKKNTTTQDNSPEVKSEDEMEEGHLRGFGLPLTRIYARYFGGEVTIRSMEGYGVDAYLYMPVLGELHLTP